MNTNTATETRYRCRSCGETWAEQQIELHVYSGGEHVRKCGNPACGGTCGDVSFTRTSPPLNRFTVKLGGPAPWEILSAADARRIAQDIRLVVAAGILSGLWGDDAATLRRYADAMDAMTKQPTLDLSVEALAG